MDETKEKMKTASMSISDQKKALKLILSDKSILDEKHIISGNHSEANVQHREADELSPNSSGQPKDGNYQPLIPPRPPKGEHKDHSNYQCLSPIDERVEDSVLFEIESVDGEAGLDNKAKNTYQSLVNNEQKENAYQCLSPVEECDAHESMATQPGSESVEGQLHFDKEAKNTYQSLVNNEQKENAYQCLSPVEERDAHESMATQPGSESVEGQLHFDKETKTTYQSLLNYDIERSADDYQTLTEFTQHQNIQLSLP